ncbi:MAG TPA: hypothetical protein PKE12_02435 [Kiritimatiellia bacterium]|nr:hypothetical protein [Kiritimatiellia bacterium]
MKKIIRFAALLVLLCGATVQAQPPLVLFQGRMLDHTGEPINDTVNIDILLYAQETGGSPVWQQTINGVDVADGVYEIHFGDAALADALTNAMCWLELEVDDELHGPRQRLVSVPYARRAAVTTRLSVDYSGVPAGVVILWSGAISNIPSGWALCDGANGTPDLRSRFVAGASNSNEMRTVVGANSLVLSSNQLPAHSHTGELAEGGAHTHSASTASGGSHTHSGGDISSGGSHTHSVTYGGYGETRGRPGGQFGNYTQFSVSLYNGGSHTHTYTVNSGGAHTHAVTVNSAGDHTHTVTLNETGGSAAIDNRPAFYAVAFIMKTE